VIHRIQSSAAAEKCETVAVAAQLGKEVSVIDVSGRRLRRSHHHALRNAEFLQIGDAAFHLCVPKIYSRTL
jgi:hypothetical protein